MTKRFRVRAACSDCSGFLTGSTNVRCATQQPEQRQAIDADTPMHKNQTNAPQPRQDYKTLPSRQGQPGQTKRALNATATDEGLNTYDYDAYSGPNTRTACIPPTQQQCGPGPRLPALVEYPLRQQRLLGLAPGVGAQVEGLRLRRPRRLRGSGGRRSPPRLPNAVTAAILSVCVVSTRSGARGGGRRWREGGV